MSTQVLGGQRRSRAIVALVVLALTLAVFVLAAEASSILSTRAGPGRSGREHPHSERRAHPRWLPGQVRVPRGPSEEQPPYPQGLPGQIWVRAQR